MFYQKTKRISGSQDIAVYKNDVMTDVIEDRLFSTPLSINLRWYRRDVFNFRSDGATLSILLLNLCETSLSDYRY